MLYHWLRRASRRADRRLLLPPLGAGRAARRAQPLRRRAGSSASSTPSATSTPAPSSSTGSSWPATCATPGGFPAVWRESELFASLREPQSAGACASCGSYDACQGGCMAAKFFTGLPLDGPDPECVLGHGEAALAALGDRRAARSLGHSKVGRDGTPIPVPHSRPLPVAGRRDLSAVELAGATWPEVEATGGHARAGRAARLARAARAASAARHRHPDRRGRWRRAGGALSPASPWRRPWPTGPAASTPAFPGTLLVGHAGAGRPAGRAGALGPPLVRRRRVVNAHGGNGEALSLVRGAVRGRGDDVLVGGRAPGGRRPRRPDRDVADAGHRPGGRAARAGRGRVHRAARRRCCPGCAPKGCGRYRPTACWATPRVRAPTRAGRCSTPWSATWRRPSARAAGPRR